MTQNEDATGKVEWRSPSNIALVKYWGKHGRQLPSNPSISFTLSQAHTTTSVKYRKANLELKSPQINFNFEGAEKPDFKDKIVKYLKSIQEELPLVSQLELDIESSNSFPHSSGIASSASSMSALALCLLEIEKKIKAEDSLDLEKASVLARLGSGSASRSVYGPIAIWGDTAVTSASSNDYAIPYTEDIDPVFHNFHDDILIISKNEKAVSSRAGHALMEDNPYALNRFEQAHRHLSEIVTAMQQGDLEKFGSIVEKEALTLHALMMASQPPYMLMEPNTIAAIKEIQQFRKEKNIPVYFTLDAGPNIHMLYPSEYADKTTELKAQLKNFCQDGLIIPDKVGNGPEKLL